MPTLVDQSIVNAGSVSLAMLADIDHASVNITAHGGLVGSPSPGAVDHVLRAGWVAFGAELDADGTQVHSVYWREPQWLNFDQTLISPDLEEYPSSHIRWWLSTGTQAHLFVAGDVHPVAPPNNALQPWDRVTTVVGSAFQQVQPGGTAVTTAFTYTVPAGKILCLSRAHLFLQRATVATTVGGANATLTVAGVSMLNAIVYGNTVGEVASDDLSGGPLYLPAGSVISGVYANNDAAGAVTISLGWSGYLFNA